MACLRSSTSGWNGVKLEAWAFRDTEMTIDESRTIIHPRGARRLGVVDRGRLFGRARAHRPPRWAKDAVIYEIYPQAFSEEGTLAAVTRALPRLQQLGVNVLWLTPIHPVGRKGRKGPSGSPYAIRDYFTINPQLGDEADLRALVERAHRLGMRVLLDFVANHVAQDHVGIQRYPDWVVPLEQGKFRRHLSAWTDVVCWDYDNARVRDYVTEALVYWVREFGIDGYRCDTAGLVPLDFWEQARRRLEEIRPDIFLLAEWSDPALHLQAFDATYDWELYDALVDIRRRMLPAQAAVELVLQARRSYPRGALRLRFLENHDEKRAADVFGLDCLEPFATMVFTLPGVPLLYNGQENGDSVRPSLFSNSVVLQTPVNQYVASMYRRLVWIRRQNPVFVTGGFVPLKNTVPTKVASYARTGRKQIAVIVLNMTEQRTEVEVHLPDRIRTNRQDWRLNFRRWQSLRLLRLRSWKLELEPFEAVVSIGSPEEVSA